MKMIRTAARAIILGCMVFALGAAHAQSPDVMALARALGGAHPAAYYKAAAGLLAKGQRDDAVFVFYLGQLRYRTHLEARRSQMKPDADPAAFSALSETVGRPLNEYAFGDIPRFLTTIDAVLAFDAANPDRFTPPGKFGAAHKTVRDGLVKMRAQVAAQADQIREQRRRNGLENRNPGR